MRIFSSFAIAAGLTLASMGPSGAAESPWCLKVVVDGLAVDRCDYRTFEKCNDERINEGNKSYCFRNPWFPGPTTRRQPASRN